MQGLAMERRATWSASAQATKPRRGGIAVLLAAVIVGSCSQERPTGPGFVASCTPAQWSQIALEVSSGTEPRFDWTPRCGLMALHVEYPDPECPECSEAPYFQPPLIAWTQLIIGYAPPIDYGVSPSSPVPDLFPREPPEPLVPGRAYTVRLTAFDRAVHAEVDVARVTFVP